MLEESYCLVQNVSILCCSLFQWLTVVLTSRSTLYTEGLGVNGSQMADSVLQRCGKSVSLL